MEIQFQGEKQAKKISDRLRRTYLSVKIIYVLKV